MMDFYSVNKVVKWNAVPNIKLKTPTVAASYLNISVNIISIHITTAV